MRSQKKDKAGSKPKKTLKDLDVSKTKGDAVKGGVSWETHEIKVRR